MFGGQDDNTSAPQGGGTQDDTLKGVDDLAANMSAAPTEPTTSDGFMPTPSEPAESGASAPEEEAEDATPPVATPAAADSDELLDLKQQALQQLTPLVGHLDQSPEDKFRTTMMLIQASDNQALLKDAYEAAQAIPDEKTKAQALLDVINEINYFTQNNKQD